MDYAGAINYIMKRLENDLPDHLHYHGHHHTKDVMEAAQRIAIAEGVSEDDLNLIKVAAAYHDSGFIDGHKDHEARGCEMAREVLPSFDFNEAAIEQVCKMILATKVPQQAEDKLSRILCDADLDYLGRDDFEYVGKTLFDELNHLGIVESIEAWNRIQLSFLTKHHYHTNYGKTKRQPEKLVHLEKIRTIVNGYED